MASLRSKEGLPPDESLGFQVRRCHRGFDRVLSAHLAPAGMTSGFWYFLRALSQENGATQRRLAQLNNVTEPTAVTVLAAMERMDLIRRDRNTQDRRKINVFLTARGEALEADLIPTAAQINAIAGEGVSPADLATCLKVLKHMSENLGRETQPLSGSPTA